MEFTWDDAVGRYRDGAGRFVSRATVRAWVDETIRRAQANVLDLAEQLRTGSLSLDTWRTRTAEQLKDIHLFSAAAGRGGWASMGPADYGRVGRQLRSQYEYLNGFAADLASGKQALDGRFTNRVKLYTQSGRVSYHAADDALQGELGKTEERNILGDAEHCEECIAEAARGWVPLGELVPIGERTCLSFCKCETEFRGEGGRTVPAEEPPADAVVPAPALPPATARDPEAIPGAPPPKDKPIVLVFGGSLNPIHQGHVAIVEEARATLERMGYQVERTVVQPAPDRLVGAKLGSDAAPLSLRARMARLGFRNTPDVEVREEPALIAQAQDAKPKRTDLADWAQRQYPNARIVNVTGADAAPGSPSSFPSVYAGDAGTSHEGYYYLALPRGPLAASSSAIRAALAAGKPAPSYFDPAVEAVYRGNWAPEANLEVVDPDPAKKWMMSRADQAVLNAEVDRYVPANPRGLDTLQRFTQADGSLTPERARLWDDIERPILARAVARQRATALMLGGGPGSGKSKLTEGMDAATLGPTVDVDELRTELPENQALIASGRNTTAAAYTHEEASALAKRITEKLVDLNTNFVQDGTGDAGIAKLTDKVAKYRRNGARVVARYVTLDTDEAWRRSVERAKKTGRVVPESVLRNTHADVSRTFPAAVKAGLFDEFELFDNNGPTQVLIAHGTGSDLIIDDEAAWLRFLAKADEMD